MSGWTFVRRCHGWTDVQTTMEALTRANRDEMRASLCAQGWNADEIERAVQMLHADADRAIASARREFEACRARFAADDQGCATT